jgi:hypothetical protein
MRDRLLASNNDLLHQLGTLQRLLGEAKVPPELAPYRAHIEKVCEEIRRLIKRNLKDLAHDHSDIFENVLNQTQRAMNNLELVNCRFAGPIIRSKEEDRLGLILLRWLHDEHPQASSRPFALSDGGFAVFPPEEWPTVYFLPSSRQHSLQYLPLLFHEFGHLLYVLHKAEMDDLVADLQIVIADSLAPMTVRSHSEAEESEGFQGSVVTAWYEWAQEFFCDAVGLRIGGPAFLSAFIEYFRVRSIREFYIPPEDQLASEHPVTWLRVTMLVDLARSLGLEREAEQAETDWRGTAKLLSVYEDYGGTWKDEFIRPLRLMIKRMLEVSEPREFRAEEILEVASEASRNPIGLLNAAWQHSRRASPTEYLTWERQTISAFVSGR